LVIALVISIVGPIGDLTESMFKRNMDIKDFGTVIRGHGGALDRFDSMLFALPFIYYITLVLTPWAS
jgi:phosphatidate cytidylyltransferase